MDLHFRAISDPPRRDDAPRGVVLSDPPLGLVGVADSTVEGPLAAAAAQLALDAIRGHIGLHGDWFRALGDSVGESAQARLVGVMQDGLGRAAKEVYALGRRKGAALAVSVDVVLTVGDTAVVGHAGAGAVYLVRSGLLHRLTLDLGVEEEIVLLPQAGKAAPLLQRGEATPLSPGMGAEPVVATEVLSIDLQEGDRVLLLSGGLCAAVPPDRLGAELAEQELEDQLRHLARLGRPVPPLLAGVQVGAALPPARLEPEAPARNRLAVLARMPLFKHCAESELRIIAGVTRPLTVQRGTLVLTEGQSGDGIYLLVAGEVEILKDGKVIARVGAGSNFGEMSMLDDPRASATVRASSRVELLVIRREAFFRLLKSNPTFAVKVLWNMLLRLSHNLRQTSARLAELTGETGSP